MDLSEVPLLVLEKVRNKWWDITNPSDRRICRPCAMCYLMRCIRDPAPCAECCPIIDDCDRVTSVQDLYWSDYRDEFLEKIIAEIDRRAM